MFEHLVVVSGMPGAGKTWLSERLASRLGYVHWSRDAVKESLWDAFERPPGIEDLEWTRDVLGPAAFDLFLRMAPLQGSRVILDAHFQARFGGHDDVNALRPGATQVFVRASLGTIYERYRARRPRQHASHQPYPLPTMADIQSVARHFEPLDLGGPLLEIDTTEGVDLDAITTWVADQRR